MKKSKSQKQLEAECQRWNAAHPVWTPIVYHPVIGEKAGRETRTRSAAYVMSGHTAVVFVEGVAGCVALDAITLPETEDSQECRLCRTRLRTLDPNGYCARCAPPVENTFSGNERCQEASILSRERYLACSAPAVAIVYHEKDRRAYFMCAPCADHNVRNRGGRLVVLKGNSHV